MPLSTYEVVAAVHNRLRRRLNPRRRTQIIDVNLGLSNFTLFQWSSFSRFGFLRSEDEICSFFVLITSFYSVFEFLNSLEMMERRAQFVGRLKALKETAAP